MLPPGKYDIQIRVANGDGRVLAGPLAVAATLYLSAAENSHGDELHLTEQGTPSLTKFVNDVRALGADQTRVYARRAAPPAT